MKKHIKILVAIMLIIPCVALLATSLLFLTPSTNAVFAAAAPAAPAAPTEDKVFTITKVGGNYTAAYGTKWGMPALLPHCYFC